jgi:hypothetical protein
MDERQLPQRQSVRVGGPFSTIDITPGAALNFLRDLSPSPVLLRLEAMTAVPLPTLGDVRVPDTFSDWRLETEADRSRAEAMRARYARPSLSCQELADRIANCRPPGQDGRSFFSLDEQEPSGNRASVTPPATSTCTNGRASDDE